MRRLSHADFGQLHDWLGPVIRRLGNLSRFCERHAVALQDARFVAEAQRAYDAAFTLYITTHYRSCVSGVAGGNVSRDSPYDWVGDGI